MCFAPIFLPAVQISPAVLEAERVIISSEGTYRVNGWQYGTESDASLARRHEAQKRVRTAARRLRLAIPCVWCGKTIAGHDPVIELGGRWIHDGTCVAEYDEFTRHDFADDTIADDYIQSRFEITEAGRQALVAEGAV